MQQLDKWAWSQREAQGGGGGELRASLAAASRSTRRHSLRDRHSHASLQDAEPLAPTAREPLRRTVLVDRGVAKSTAQGVLGLAFC